MTDLGTIQVNPKVTTSPEYNRCSADRRFDGVICFGGEDWWYHNRGHYDMQIMRELSGRVPVLYVNSIGMRVPRVTEGRMFFKRISRKLRSLRRGLVRIHEGFAVFSPAAVPGKFGMSVSKAAMAWQVRRAARQLGIQHPLIWVACPPAADVVPRMHGVGMIYQRTDRYEAFRHVDPDAIRSYDRKLKAEADATVFCSTHLYEEEGQSCREAWFIDHGVDFDRFAEAGRDRSTEPGDLSSIGRPRVGFIGGIDRHTFDPELFVDVVRRLPDVQFVMVGACSLESDWCTAANVHFLGQRPYEQVASYMSACDVLIMPWNSSDWIKACNPVKLKEYLAVGRGIVSTAFDELHRYEGLVRVANDSSSFAQAIHDLLASPPDEPVLRRRVIQETWAAKGDLVIDCLARQGLVVAT